MKRSLTAIFLTVAILAVTVTSVLVSVAASSIKSLEDVITAVESARESDYTPAVWSKLQENRTTAKMLTEDHEYFAIRADVPNEAAVLWDIAWPSGHNNYNKYLSIYDGFNPEGIIQSYLTYKGHGENDYEKADFTPDQLWEKVTVDEEKGVFMLRNLEYDAYLCGIRADGWTESPHQYFRLMKLSEIKDMSRARFYMGADNVLRIEYISPGGAVYVDMYHSNDTLRSGGIQGVFTFPEYALVDPRASTPKTVFEQVDVSDIKIDTETETRRIISDTNELLGLQINGYIEKLYGEYQNALGDLPYHYDDPADYAALQAGIRAAESLMNGDMVQVIHNASKMALAPTQSGKAALADFSANQLPQVWYQLRDGDRITFMNAFTKEYLYHSAEQLPAYAGLVDFGRYLKVGTPADFAGDPDAAEFKLTTKNLLQPVLTRTETVDTVTVTFAEEDGLAFTTAGVEDRRKVHTLVANGNLMRSEADRLLDEMREIRRKRLSAMDTTVEKLQELCNAIDNLDKESYTDSSWNALKTALESAKETLKNKNPTVAELNLAEYALQNARNALKKKDDIIPEGDETYQNATDEIEPLYTTMLSKKYTPETIERGNNALSALLIAASNGTNGIKLITFGELDTLLSQAHYAYDNLVESQHYTNLTNAINAVTNRQSTPEGYCIRLEEARFQPDTWAEMMRTFAIADKIMTAFDSGIWETPTDQVKTAAADLNTAISGLVIKPDYTALSAVLEMLDRLEIDPTVFTADSWSSYETVYGVAKELVGDEYAGQVAVDALTNELITAANSLKIDGVDGEVPLLPGISPNLVNRLEDRYDVGYDDGYMETYYEQSDAGREDGIADAQIAFNNERIAEKAENVSDAVDEVTTVVNRNHKKNKILEDYPRIYLPLWLILVLAGSAVAAIAVGFGGGFLIAKNAKAKKKSGKE